MAQISVAFGPWGPNTFQNPMGKSRRNRNQASKSAKSKSHAKSLAGNQGKEALEDGIVNSRPSESNVRVDPETEDVTVGRGRNAVTFKNPKPDEVIKRVQNYPEALSRLPMVRGRYNQAKEIHKDYASARDLKLDLEDEQVRKEDLPYSMDFLFPLDARVVQCSNSARIPLTGWKQFQADTGLYREGEAESDEGTFSIASVTRFEGFEACSDIEARLVVDGQPVDPETCWFTLKAGAGILAMTQSKAFQSMLESVHGTNRTRKGVWIGSKKTEAELEHEKVLKAKQEKLAQKKEQRARVRSQGKDKALEEVIERLSKEPESVSEDAKVLRSPLTNQEGTVLIPYPHAVPTGTMMALWLECYWNRPLREVPAQCHVELTWKTYAFLEEARDSFVLAKNQWFYHEYSLPSMTLEGLIETKNMVAEIVANTMNIYPGTWAQLEHTRASGLEIEAEMAKAEKKAKAVRFKEELEEEEKTLSGPDMVSSRSGPSSGKSEEKLKSLLRQSRARNPEP